MGHLPKPPDSPARRTLHYVVGVVLPIVLLALDPIVFHNRLGAVDGPLLGPFKAGCYTATGVFVVSLIWWLRTGRWPAQLAGVLASGCCFALLIGCLMLPFSLIGIMMMGLGLLGLTPFAMAWVYGRQAFRAFGAAAGVSGRVRNMAIGLALPIAISVGMQFGTRTAYRTAIDSALANPGKVPPPGVTALRILSPLVDLDQIVESYSDESDPARREAYKHVYAAVTGDDIEDRLRERAD